MLRLSRRAAVLGLPGLSAIGGAAAAPRPSPATPDFSAAVLRYQQVCERMRRHQALDDLPQDALDTDLDLLEEATADLLRIPSHGPAEALVLLTICHYRMYGPLAGIERGFFGEIERLDVEQELTWSEQDRALIEKAIDALKGEC